MTVLVTGAAGFIGFHVTCALLTRGDAVIGVDNLNDYYDVSLKEARLDELRGHANQDAFKFVRADVSESEAIGAVFTDYDIDAVIHLAAQAGVRYSIENPRAYIQTNVFGFMNILEECREAQVAHLVYASSSSVYGNNQKVPYAIEDNVDHPISIYAASKKSNELMAHVYSHLYQLPTTGLRFFTVYGPWGRPDMSPFIFASSIINGDTVRLFNHGHHARDFTYIDDIVDGILRIFDAPLEAQSGAPYAIHNIGNHRPVDLLDYLNVFERVINKKAVTELVEKQPGDVESTFADISTLQDGYGYQPSTTVEQGVVKFVKWYREYYRV